MPPARLVDHRRARTVSQDIDDLGTRDQPGGRPSQSFVQQLEQRAAMNAETVGVLMQICISEIQDNVLEVVQSQETFDPGTQPQRVLSKPEPTQHRLAG